MNRIVIVLLLLITCFNSGASGSYIERIKKVDSFIESNQLDSASIYLKEIGKHVRAKKNSIFQLAYYDRCALVQKHEGNHKNILTYYDSISALLPFIKPENGNDSMLVARGYFCYATTLGVKNKFSESIEPYRKAILFSESKPDNKLRSYYYQNIGLSYLRIGQVEIGLQNVNKAFSIYDINKDHAGKFGCVVYIGSIMVDYRNFDLARKYFDIALTLKDSIKDEYEKSGLYNDIGRMYNYEMKYDSALVNFNLSLSESTLKKNDYLTAIAECNIGETLMKQGNYKKAIITLNRALQKFNSFNFDLGIFQTTHLIAFCEYKKNDLKKADFFQNQAEKLLLKTEVYPSLIIDFYKRSYELRKGLGELSESLVFLEKYQCMQDSVNSVLTNWKVNEIESRLLTSVKEKQLIQKEIELNAHKMIIWIIVTLFLLATFITGIIALYIRKRREAEYQKQLGKMTALRMQNARNTMSPHFFFNVLSSLSGLSHQPELIKEKLKSLSLLLRKVIENIDQTAISLDQELEAVKAYIDLNMGKIPEPFTVEYLIAEGTKLHGLIPAMMIQIPVENAIKHGLMPLEGEKKLTISVTDFDGYQQITVSDNGIGLKASTGRSSGTGTGLKVLMQTIHLLNINNQQKIKFSVSELEPNSKVSSGTAVEIQIPYDFNYTL